jgi:LysM repeat protein
MKRTTYVLLGTLVTIMGVAFIVAVPTGLEESTYAMPDIQLSFDPSQIVRIEIIRNNAYMRLERMQGGWRITEPVDLAVDGKSLDQLLKGIAKFRLTGLVSSNPSKQGIFQVNERGTKVVLTSEDGRSVPLIVGKASSRQNQAFVRPASSNTVYLAYGVTPAMVNRDLLDWSGRKIYKTDSETINSISVQLRSEIFFLHRSGNNWTCEDREIPHPIMSTLLKNVSDIQAEDFVDTTFINTGLPLLKVAIAGRDPIRLEFFGRALSSAKLFLKTSGTPSMFVVNKATIEGVNRLAGFLSEPEQQPVPVEVAKKEKEKEKEPPKEVALVPASKKQEIQKQEVQLVPQSTSQMSKGQSVADEGDLVVHSVKRGETLESIAGKYTVTTDQIKRWNQLQKGTVSPGMELYVFVKKK